MQRILSNCRSLPLFGSAAARRLEQSALATTEPHALMRRAGLAVARLALAVAPNARRVWVAAGPGNNGGDGFEAALHLRAWGRDVRITLAGDAAKLPADARDAFERARAGGIEFVDNLAALPELGADDIAIDALLGLGASRAPEGRIAAEIQRLNTLHCPVLAVDVPSGLNTDTGQLLGGACVVARHTLALLSLKPGLFTAAGRDHAGQVWLDTIGVAPEIASTDAWLVGTGDARALTQPRQHAQHKGSFGDVAIVAGAPGMTGAAWLASRAALAAGAGRVFVDLLDERVAVSTFDPQRPELMWRPGWWRGDPAVLEQATVVCGCGGGKDVGATLPTLLTHAGRLVLDADALNAIAADATLQDTLRGRRGAGRETVLTPHPLEAARLLACTTADIQADRLTIARRLADRFDAVVVLKGSGSVIATPGEVPRINLTGNAALAAAGTGDVLAGWLGGSWAQGGTAFDAATRAVIEHGAAVEPLEAGSIRADDLIEALHRRLRAGV